MLKSARTILRGIKKNELLLFLIGLNLMLFNFVMVHHTNVAFRQLEFAIMLFTLSYFSGISLGYLFSDRLTEKVIIYLIPLFIVVQLLLIIYIQPLSYIITSVVNERYGGSNLTPELGVVTAYLIIFIILFLGGTSLFSIFLPKIIEAEESNIAKFYSIEVAGSIVGLLLIPILSSISHLLMIALYLVIFIIILLLLTRNKLVLILTIVPSLLFILFFNQLDKKYSGWFYKQWYGEKKIEKVIYTKYSPYQKIEMLQLSKRDKMLVLNGKRQFARGSHYNYSYFIAEYPINFLSNPSVCVLGCGSMSTVGRIGDISSSIDIVDIDEEVFNTSKKYFQKYNRLNKLNNWTFIADDAKHYLANSKKKYDLILHDIPPAYSRQIAMTYTEEFFKVAKSKLNDNGIFSISSLTPLSSRSEYGKRMIATLASVFDHYIILQYRGSAYFYGGNKKFDNISKKVLMEKVNHKGKKKIKFLLKYEIDKIVDGVKIITLDNLGDLIFE
ncbi:MAG: hypothetical protein L3J41_03560 [Melioribacteraceae bacterium]|nr:hypothetical protein [Melioribacteraceae bacterium]